MLITLLFEFGCFLHGTVKFLQCPAQVPSSFSDDMSQHVCMCGWIVQFFCLTPTPSFPGLKESIQFQVVGLAAQARFRTQVVGVRHSETHVQVCSTLESRFVRNAIFLVHLIAVDKAIKLIKT